MAMTSSQVAVLMMYIRAENTASATLRTVSRDVEGLGATMSRIGQTAMIAGIGLGAALGAALKGTVGPAMDFEKVLSGIGAVSSATGAQMQQLSALALQLGKDTVFSASEAGSAIEELAKGGISIQDILGGAAKATVNLAAAGQVSLPQAATIAAGAMNTFGIAGTQMAHVSDLIAGAANASSLEVGDFAYSLQYAGSTARAVGLGFDDLAVAIAELGRQNIVGSQAGTQLADFLARLQPRAGQALKTMEQLGLVTKQGGNAFFDATGHIKGMADIQQTLQNATRGLTDQQRQHVLQLIFGQQAQIAANILLREGAQGYTDMAAAVGRVTAQGVASARLNNLAGDLTNLSGSLETLRIQLGEGFGGGAGMPVFRQMAQGINAVVGGMIDWTKAHGPLLAQMMPLVAIITAGTAAALTFGGAFALLAAAMNPVTATLLGLTVAVAAVGVAWSQNWGGMRAALESAWSGIQPALQTLQYMTRTLADDVRRGDWQAAWRDALAMGQAAIGRFTDWMGSTALPAIQAHLGQWAMAFGTWGRQLWSTTVQPALGAFGTQVVGWLNSMTTTIRANTAAWAQALANSLSPSKSQVDGAMSVFTDTMIAWVQSDGVKAMVNLGNAMADAFVATIVANWKKNLTPEGIWNALSHMSPLQLPIGGGLDVVGAAGRLPQMPWNSGAWLPAGQLKNQWDAQFNAWLGSLTADQQKKWQEMMAQVTGTKPPVPTVAPVPTATPTPTVVAPPPTITPQDSAAALHAMYVRLGLSDMSPAPIATGGQALAGALAARISAHYAQQAAALERSLQFGSPEHQRAVAALGGAGGASGGTGGTGAQGTALAGVGAGAPVNITVEVRAGAVTVQGGGSGADEARWRTFAQKVGEGYADTIATLAKAERMVSTPGRPALGGSRG